MPALSVERLTVLVYASLAACAILLLVVVALGMRLSRIRRAHAHLLVGARRETAQLGQRLSARVKAVGFTRYDAYPDIGGQLSFSAAFLDEAGDGVVLSTINGRSDSRSYAKAVKGGHSDHQLSEEERTAIAMAMGESRSIARSSV